MEAAHRGPGPVLRLTVERHDGQWRVVGETRVDEMTVPGSQELPDPGPARRVTGLWFEVVDADDHVLYRQILHEPPPGPELHHRDGRLSRMTAASDAYGTDLRVPLVDKGAKVRLLYVPSTVDVQGRDAGEKAPTSVLEHDLVQEKKPVRGKKRGQ
ncbi:hypothetical protein [Gordonia rhizosphera]|uniref:Uncharacterized protein n=1 Tax=Gordonia rhizosphera NBRC 16068 TaxID=1108045 RepID=K6WF09_9ACTN|nr:hypothetical protein [Gordonia rhizosphera]GAB90772.1 hypothetical protein GORHZ_117_00360 [Gordonia rhizosphera NBRC 16068]